MLKQLRYWMCSNKIDTNILGVVLKWPYNYKHIYLTTLKCYYLWFKCTEFSLLTKLC